MAFDPAVIRASFAVVERRADHLTTYFYAHLFSHHPGLRPLFPAQLDEQRDRLFAAPTRIVLQLDEPERLAELLLALGAAPEPVRHDPAPVTFNRARPLTSSDWFLDRRNVPWINRTDLE